MFRHEVDGSRRGKLRWYHEIALIKLPSALLWIVISGVALFAWLAALQMAFTNSRAANIVSTALLFPLMMAGGSFFPLAVMPDWMAAIGKASPNGYIAEQLTAEILSTNAFAIAPSSWLLVGVAAIAGLMVCAWRLRSGFAQA